MRMFIFLIILAALSLFAGIVLRDIYNKYSNIAFTISAILFGLAAAGMFGWF